MHVEIQVNNRKKWEASTILSNMKRQTPETYNPQFKLRLFIHRVRSKKKQI